jgi:hypothetical protein
MEHLPVTTCRTLIAEEAAEKLAEPELIRLRDMLYTIADVISDAFADLRNIDQQSFNPPGDAVDSLNQIEEALP